MAFQGGFNSATEIVRRQQVLAQTDQDLDSMLVALRSYYASHCNDETKSCIEAVENEQNRRQKQRHHNEAQAELKRLHQAQMVEVKQLFAESNADSDKKHAESLKTSKEANVLSKKAIRIARLSFWAAIIIGLAGIVVAWFLSTRTANESKAIPQTNTLQAIPEKPQIVLPKPLPIVTNPIPTNAIQKK